MSSTWNDNACLEAAVFASAGDETLYSSSTSRRMPTSGSPAQTLWSLHSPDTCQSFSIERSQVGLSHLPGDDEQMQFFTEGLHRLREQVRSQEDRQVSMDRRLMQVDSQLQALREEQEFQKSHLLQYGSRSPAGLTISDISPMGDGSTRLQQLEKGQRAVAAAVQRAMQLVLKSEDEQKVLGARIDAYRGGGVESAIQAAGRATHDAHVATEKTNRLSRKLEDQQQAQVSVEKQLDQQQQLLSKLESKLQGQLDIACLEQQQRQIAELEKTIQGSLNMQDASLDMLRQRQEEHDKQLRQIDASIADLQSSVAAEALFSTSPKATRRGLADASFDPDEHVQAADSGGSAMPFTPRHQEPEAEAAPTPSGTSPLTKVETMGTCLTVGKQGAPADSFELQVQAGLNEVRSRLNQMQQTLDKTVLVRLRQMVEQVPETSRHFERLDKRCAECFAKVQLDLSRTAIATQDDRWRALCERVESILAQTSGAHRAAHTGLPSTTHGLDSRFELPAHKAAHTGVPSATPHTLDLRAELLPTNTVVAYNTSSPIRGFRDRPTELKAMPAEWGAEDFIATPPICGESSREALSCPRQIEVCEIPKYPLRSTQQISDRPVEMDALFAGVSSEDLVAAALSGAEPSSLTKAASSLQRRGEASEVAKHESIAARNIHGSPGEIDAALSENSIEDIFAASLCSGEPRSFGNATASHLRRGESLDFVRSAPSATQSISAFVSNARKATPSSDDVDDCQAHVDAMLANVSSEDLIAAALSGGDLSSLSNAAASKQRQCDIAAKPTEASPSVQPLASQPTWKDTAATSKKFDDNLTALPETSPSVQPPMASRAGWKDLPVTPKKSGGETEVVKPTEASPVVQPLIPSQTAWKDTSATSKKLDDICAKLGIKGVDSQPSSRSRQARGDESGTASPTNMSSSSARSSLKNSAVPLSCSPSKNKEEDAQGKQIASNGLDDEAKHQDEVSQIDSEPIEPQVSVARGRAYAPKRHEKLEATSRESEVRSLPVSLSPSGRNKMNDFTGL
eukprot:TRINITY_DN14256_c0_g1_i1.p1 TRINITY_DN14256_c0_g1~~TRINITY_DN14256_c0_g1_i1.p1  ORF type:complete len:1026 (+),score=190.87 TRINITY_DN14256_c0_g1_i1:66-3143(+)